MPPKIKFSADDAEMRRLGLGTSDFPILMQASKYKTPVDLWAEKTGRVEPEDLSKKDAVFWGIHLEEPILRAIPNFFPELPHKVRKDRRTYWGNEYIYAHLDGRIGKDIAEIKNQSIFQSTSWDDGQIPPWYYWQGIAALLCCKKAEAWHIFALLGGQNLVHRTIYREDCINDIKFALMRADEFWNKNVKEDVAPEIQNESDLRLVYPPEETFGSILITEEIKKKLEKASELDSLISRLGKQAKELKGQAKIAIGQAETVNDGEGNVLYTFTYRKGKTTVDSAKLKKEFPDIYEQVIKVGNPYRALSKKKGNDEQ